MRIISKFSFTAGLIAAALSTQASAADWSGFYAGAIATSDSGDYHEYAIAPSFVGPTFGLSGSTFGAMAGFNVDTGMIVYGGEIAVSAAGSATTNGGPGQYSDGIIDGKIRAGYEFGNALIYLAAGFSAGNFEIYNAPVNVSGYNFGIGLDYQITPTSFVGIEYLARSMNGVVLTPDEVEVNVNSISIRYGYLF